MGAPWRRDWQPGLGRLGGMRRIEYGPYGTEAFWLLRAGRRRRSVKERAFSFPGYLGHHFGNASICHNISWSQELGTKDRGPLFMMEVHSPKTMRRSTR